jgi:hypothetical protein
VEAVTSPAIAKPLFAQFPRRGRSPSAAEAFAMHKRRIQEGFEPGRAATRTTVLAMVVQICFLGTCTFPWDAHANAPANVSLT